jgi:hypothetical protein
MQGHRLNRLAFELAQLTHHRVKKLGARFTAAKTVVKGGLELPQVVHEAFHVTADNVKRGNGKTLTFGPTGW